MKRLFLLAALGLATATSMPAVAGNLTGLNSHKDDTVLVKLANGAKMTLFLKNTDQLKSFQTYSLDSLMRTLNTYITEADKKQQDFNGKDYTVTYKPAEETKNKKAPEKISITFKGTNKETGKKEDKAVNIIVNYDEDGENNGVTISSDPKSAADTISTKPKRKSRTDDGFDISLGFNTLLNTGDNELGINDLRPWGSRFVNLGWRYQVRIGGQKSPLNVRTGVDFAFHNFMFEGNTRVQNNNGYTVFYQDTKSLEKTKLATTSVNLPLMFILDFKNKKHNSAFRIGAGGFGGYRIGAHTKIKYDLEGEDEKDKDHGNFNLEDFQYGAKFIIGYRDIDFFATYNLNELFKDDRGPKANALSFGIMF
jgi:hypothetical protein